MTLTVKHYSELTADELFEILRLRQSVFIVEQNCPYNDIGTEDKSSYHIWLSDESGIVAYARALPPGTTFESAAVGRVVSVKRRRGLATRVVEEAVRVAHERFGADVISLEAQVYARGLYEKLGFVQCSDVFLEDGIEHINMMLRL